MTQRIGQRIRAARQDRSMTLQQVVERVGTDTANLSRIERGEYLPRFDMLERLAAVFELRLTELLTYGDAPVQYAEARDLPLGRLRDVAALQDGTPVAGTAQTLGRCGDRAFAIEIEDESMAPVFRAGDRCVVDPDVPAGDGDIALIHLADHRQYLIRTLRYYGPDAYALPGSAAFPSLHLTGNWRVIGRVTKRLAADL